MHTNLLGPQDASHVKRLTELETLSPKEKAILIACVQNNYEEAIHRLAMFFGMTLRGSELHFVACILRQFYHKAETEAPEKLADIANGKNLADNTTTNLLKLFLLQVDKGFKGVPTNGIPKAVKEISEGRIAEETKKSPNLSSEDRDFLKLAILADELCNHTSFSMARRIFRLAEEVKKEHHTVDLENLKSSEIFSEALAVGSKLRTFNINITKSDRELLNRLHRVQASHLYEIQQRLKREKKKDY
ncbi:MAG: hypothetical protein AB8F78_14695 [Saprospiraceae bacterium]